MRVLLFAVLALCVAMAFGQSATPIMFFSQNNYFSSSKINPHPVPTAQLTEFFTDLLSGPKDSTKLSKGLEQIQSTKLPSSVLVWTQTGLTTPTSHDMLGFYRPNEKYTKIQEKIKHFVPNAIQENSSTFYRSLMITAAQSNKDFNKDATCADITAYITAAVQSTTKTTLIKANGTELASLDVFESCLDDILSTYNGLTGGNYLIILQGVQQNGTKIEKKNKMAVLDDSTPKATAAVRAGPQYVGPQTLVAIFVVFILGAYLVFSVNHLMAIEGPLRFPVASQLPAQTREY